MRNVSAWLAAAAALILIGLAASLQLLLPPGHGAFKIEIVDPGSQGSRVDEAGVFANVFPARGAGPHPGVLLLGGSEGGLGRGASQIAQELQAEGFSVLHLAYFGAPGQPETLERIPLEQFDRGLDWLAKQPDVDAGKLALLGVSKGAEAALLVAARRADLRAVVAAAPSSVVWNGIDWNRAGQGRATSWSHADRDLASLPYGTWTPREGVLSVYSAVLDPAFSEEAERAAIPVERARAPILLVCGTAETLWPSCPMAHQLVARAGRLDGPPISLLEYEDAGHLSFGPPLAKDHPFYNKLDMWGGSPDGNAAARADSWPRAIDFLRAHTQQDAGG